MYEIINQSNIHETEINDLSKFINYVVKQENLSKFLFNISIVDDETIKNLNREYRNVDKVTDVISFEYGLDDDIKDPEVRLLGEIFISINKAKEQALEYGHSLKRELCFLALHGILHLLGYDHMNEADEKVMFQKQEEILNGYGITR